MLNLSPVETRFHKARINLYGIFILGVNVKYCLPFVSLVSKWPISVKGLFSLFLCSRFVHELVRSQKASKERRERLAAALECVRRAEGRGAWLEDKLGREKEVLREKIEVSQCSADGLVARASGNCR